MPERTFEIERKLSVKSKLQILLVNNVYREQKENAPVSLSCNEVVTYKNILLYIVCIRCIKQSSGRTIKSGLANGCDDR